MASRYQSTGAIASGSIAAGATLNINTTGLPSLFNIHKITVVPDSAGGSFDYRVYKADTFAAAKLLALWDNVANGTTGLVDPMDDTSGVPAAANEGAGIPYDDDDDTGELHHQLINNDGTSHTYTITILYEEVPKVVSVGSYQARSTAPRWMWYEDGVGADLKAWDAIVDASVLSFRTRTDADGAGVTWMSVTRGATTAVSGVNIPGNLALGSAFTPNFALHMRRAATAGSINTDVFSYLENTTASQYTTFKLGGANQDCYFGYLDSPTAASRKLDFAVGGTTIGFTLTQPGQALSSDGTAAAPSVAGINDPNTGLVWPTGDDLRVSTGGTSRYNFGTGSLQFDSSMALAWSSGLIGASSDIFLIREGPNVPAFRNAANATTFRVYGTYTDDSNYERGQFAVSTTAMTIEHTAAGTGANRPLRISTNGSSDYWEFDAGATPHFAPLDDNTYDFGKTAQRIRTGYFGTRIVSGVATNATGNIYIGEDDAADLYIDTAVTSTAGSAIYLRKARGTQASRTIVASGDTIGELNFQGIEDATDYRTAAQIIAKVDGTPGAATDMPGRLEFYTTPDGSVTSTLAMTISSSQQVLAEDGIVTLPSLGFRVDPTLGFYRQATTTITATGILKTINKFVGTSASTIDTSGAVGLLYLADDAGSVPAYLSTASSTSTHRGVIEFTRMAGTHASPSNVADGYLLGEIRATARSTSNQATAAIKMVVDGTFTAGDRPPSRFEFYTNVANGAQANTLTLTGIGNLGLGTQTFGTSAAAVLGIFNGTEPSTSPADMVQLYSVDLSAGNATLGLRTETAVAVDALLASTHTLSVRINGTTYKILLST